jgi:flagellar hook assembly protein FlgD
MLDGTDFTFELSQGADVRIKIFTVDGRLIRTLNGFWAQPGFNVMGWDGLDFEGDAVSNGVYLYKVIARAGAGSKTIEASAVGKLIVMR